MAVKYSFTVERSRSFIQHLLLSHQGKTLSYNARKQEEGSETIMVSTETVHMRTEFVGLY